MTKKQSGHRNLVVVLIAVLTMMTALLFCAFMIRSINLRMNESATSNLLNTTRVIESTLQTYINQDFESLQIVGDFYKNREYLEQRQIETLCKTMGFEQIQVVDSRGNGVDCFAGKFRAADIPCYGEWTPGVTGYSDAYFGQSGRLQTTLWLPIYRDETFIGTVFGDVVLTKYYSANVFTFYEGDGRTYLFDGTDGSWILRSLGTDGASRRQEDIYSLLLLSGNRQKDVQAFQQAIEQGHTGTAVLRFNDQQSYICFMPLASASDWYVATIIAKDVLLRESSQVRRTIQLTLTVFCLALLFFTVSFAVWQVRKTKEQEAAYREALFMNVSANIDSAFLIYEKKSKRTVFVSDNVRRLLGLDREWLQRDAGNLFTWCNLQPEDPQRLAFLEGTLTEPAVREVCVENEMGQKDRYIRLELIPADLGQEIAVLTDITKDKDIQSSLLEAMQRAEAASHAKNEFLSAMSHDIRTPMNGIIGMTAIATAHLGDENRVRDCLGKITEASAHLLTIINEVLDMSQIESGKFELSHVPFNMAELLQDVLNISYPGIQQKNHTIKVHIHAMDHEQVIGDPARLQRVVVNLISNAIKYTPDGGMITLALEEKPPMIKGYGCYALTVQDNGIGMSQEFQERLFQPFEREEDVRVSRIQGTGLGMSIVKNTVSLMMGDIQVESEKHKGTTFRVTVNLRLDAQPEADGAALDSLPVLVVDDDRVVCETVSAMLCDIGMAGEWVDNGADAVALVTERHRKNDGFLAVLLDWKMPGMNGVETARRIRANVDASIPIIILTAYDWSEIESEAREAGVNAFISKPIYKAKLRQKMTEIAAGSAEAPGLLEQEGAEQIPPGKRILLVEDNELNREIATELLQMLNLQVDWAENGAAAVERFASSAPGTYDLILMDVQMPKMNGYEATKAIRKLERPDSGTVPIVAMTADTFAKDIRLAYEAGMDEHLAKPISMERLVQLLAQFLSGSGRTTRKKEGTSGDETIFETGRGAGAGHRPVR